MSALTRAEAYAAANKIAAECGIDMLVVLEGIHRDDDAPEDSHGYCPVRAKPSLYRFAEITDTIPAGGAK